MKIQPTTNPTVALKRMAEEMGVTLTRQGGWRLTFPGMIKEMATTSGMKSVDALGYLVSIYVMGGDHTYAEAWVVCKYSPLTANAEGTDWRIPTDRWTRGVLKRMIRSAP